ncbi:MAG: phage holin family protein [Limisphaerales bacterium]
MRLIVNWLLSAIALLIVTRVVPGFEVRSFVTALIAAAVIGIINATLGLFLKVLTFQLTVVTLGIFWIVVNALMLEFASVFVRGFEVRSFAAAFIGAILLSLINMVFHWLAPRREERRG